MAEIITYNDPLTGNPNQCFCQMKFEDGMKILISQSKGGIKIIKLLFGFIPKKILYKAHFTEQEKHDKFMQTQIESMLLLDHYVETIKNIKSSKELINFINN